LNIEVEYPIPNIQYRFNKVFTKTQQLKAFNPKEMALRRNGRPQRLLAIWKESWWIFQTAKFKFL